MQTHHKTSDMHPQIAKQHMIDRRSMNESNLWRSQSTSLLALSTNDLRLPRVENSDANRLSLIQKQNAAEQLAQKYGNQYFQKSVIRQRNNVSLKQGRAEQSRESSPTSKAIPKTYQIEFEGETISLNEEEYKQLKARMVHNLGVQLTHIESLAQSGKESQLDFLSRIRNWAGVVSDFIAMNKPPAWEIWNWPNPAIRAGRIALKAGNLQSTVAQIEIADRSLREAQKHWNRYVDKNIGGSEKAIAGLGFVRDTSFAIAVGAATVVTGGAASTAGVGLLGRTALAEGVAFLGSGLQESVTQLSEMAHGLRNDFDFVDLLRNGASEAVAALVGACAGGALTPHIQKLFGSYLGKAAPELLEELGRIEKFGGPIPKDYFFTKGQKIITDFLEGVATSPLQTAVRTVVDRVSGKSQKMPTPAEFAQQVFDEMVQGGIQQLFVSTVIHSASSASGSMSSKPQHHPSPNMESSVPTLDSSMEPSASHFKVSDVGTRTNETSVPHQEGLGKPPSGTGEGWKLVTLPAGTKLYAVGERGKTPIRWGAFQEHSLIEYVAGNQWHPSWGAERGQNSRTPLVEYSITIDQPTPVWAGKVADQPSVGVPQLGGQKIQYYRANGLGSAVPGRILGWVPGGPSEPSK